MYKIGITLILAGLIYGLYGMNHGTPLDVLLFGDSMALWFYLPGTLIFILAGLVDKDRFMVGLGIIALAIPFTLFGAYQDVMQLQFAFCVAGIASMVLGARECWRYFA
jgi:hypothetical protein